MIRRTMPRPTAEHATWTCRRCRWTIWSSGSANWPGTWPPPPAGSCSSSQNSTPAKAGHPGTCPNGHMSRPSLGAPRACSPWVKIAGPAYRTDAFRLLVRGMPVRRVARFWWLWRLRAVPGVVDLPSWTRSPCMRAGPGIARGRHGSWDTPDAGCGESGAPAGRVGRGLSHSQDGPLTMPGAAELQSGLGPCEQLRSRTADRMAVPASPSIRERA
jgi:hypothetical protein